MDYTSQRGKYWQTRRWMRASSNTLLVVGLLLALLLTYREAIAAEIYQYTGQWGGAGSGNSRFNGPYGIAIDASGNVYVADTANNRVQKFNSVGTYLTQWGSAGAGNRQFNAPRGIAVDASGNVYVADTANNRIQKFDSVGTYLTQWGTPGSGNRQFNSPSSVAVDASGNVYVTDASNNRIQKFTSAGTYLTQWGSAGGGNGGLNIPCDLAVDTSGNVYVADTRNNRIQKFNSTGTYLTQWGSAGTGNGRFDTPCGIAVDGSGNVYVADTYNHRIQKFDATGTFIATWGSNGGNNGQFQYVTDMTVASDGTVYGLDWGNNRVQTFASVVVITSAAPAAGTFGISYSHTFVASGPTAPTFSVTTGSLPPGLMLNATTGVLSGTPTQAGSTSFTVTATSGTRTGTQNVTLVINKANQTITFATPSAQTYGTTLALTSSASSGLDVTYTSSTTGVCTVNNTTDIVTFVGTGTCTIVAAQSGSANYNAAVNVSASFAVNKANQTITFANPGAQTYGAALTLTGSASSGLTISYSSSTTSVCTISGSTANFVGVGTCTITAAQSGNTNYNAATNVAQTFTVNKATPTITWADPAAITYGTALGATQLNASTGVAGTFTYTPPSSTVLNAGADQPLSVTFTPTNGAFYTTATKSVTIDVNKLTPTITWANPAAITYGSALSATQLNATASVPGTLVYAPSSGTVLNAGANQTLSVTFTPTNTANYSTATKSVTISVNKANQTITFGALANKTYGDAALTISGSTSSGLAVTFTSATSTVCSVSGSTVTIINAGTCTINANQAGNTNYNAAAQVGQSFTVNKATLTVTADDKTRVYGVANPTLTATYSGFVNGETLATSGVTGSPACSTVAGTGSTPGTYAITCTASTLASSKYSFGFTPGTLTITKATLTVTANNQSRAYGAVNPTLTASYSGFVNGDSATAVSGAPDCTTSATNTSIAGSYPITCAAGTLTSSKYSFQFVNGTLTVSKATLTVTADNQSRAYGTANPTLTASYSGFANGETLATSGVTGNPSCTTTATTTSAPGTYTITCAAGTLTAANYSFQFAPGTLTVSKAVLDVTATDKTRVYGAANPTLTATYSGFVNGETLATSGVTGSPACATTATSTSAVGSYSISCATGTLASTKYTFGFVDGTLTITNATLTVTANNQSRAYGTADPAFTASYSGFVNGDTAAVVTGAPDCTTAATSTSPPSSYPITCAAGTLTANNYSFQFVNGTLTIIKATLTVTADDQTRAYGAANPPLTASYSGFVNGETLATSDVRGAPACSTTATTGSALGNYKITCAAGSLASNNYDFQFGDGTLTIVKAVLTVTANDQTRTYGATNPPLTMSYNGFVNGETLATSDVTGSPACTTTASNTSAVNTYAITCAAGTLASSKYSFQFADGTLAVTKASLIVKADDQSRTYGGVNPPLTASYSGFVNGETLATSGVSGGPSCSTTAINTSTPGTYPITCTASTLASKNYNFQFADGTLTITKAVLTITANDQSRVYSAANPALTVIYSGFANGETLATSDVTGSPNCTTTATTASAASAYLITCTAGTLAATNYSFQFVDGTLMVTPATLTVKANASSRMYGAPNPAFSVTYTGFVGSDNATSLGGALTFNTAATASSAVGSYPVTPGGLTSSNYTINVVPGTLSVTKAVLNVTGNDVSRVYGASNPGLTASYTGFVNGDTAAVVSGSPACATSASVASNVGPYAITCAAGTLAATNYSFQFVDGTLSITKAPLKVTARDAIRKVGASNPAFLVSYSGFVNGESEAVLGGVLAVDTPATTSSAAATYPIVPSGLTSSNYAITFVNGTLTVTDKDIPTVTWANPATITYGTALGNAQLNATASVPGSFAYAPASGTVLHAGNQQLLKVIFTPNDPAIYASVSAQVTIDVTPADLIVTANDARRRAGNPDPAFTVRYAGFIDGDTSASVGGTLLVTTTATTASPAGSYPIVPAGLSSADYAIHYVNGTLTIADKDTVLLTWATPAAITYGTPLSEAQLNATASIPGTFAYTPAKGIVLHAGTQQSLTVTFTPSDATIYAPATQQVTIDVTPAPLTVTANDASRRAGAVNPAFSAHYDGLVNGDTPAALQGTLAFSTPATATSPAGSYPIVPAGLSSADYSIQYSNGTLTITPEAVTSTQRMVLTLFLHAPFASPAPAPYVDLAISNLQINPNKASFTTGEAVVLTVDVVNQGTQAAEGFWVDLYFNPSQPPTAANQPWNKRCELKPCLGISWYVNGLKAGERIALSSQQVAKDQSRWAGWLAQGTTDIYAYADSWNPGVSSGGVAERDETNNRAELHGLTVRGTNPASPHATLNDLRTP